MGTNTSKVLGSFRSLVAKTSDVCNRLCFRISSRTQGGFFERAGFDRVGQAEYGLIRAIDLAVENIHVAEFHTGLERRLQQVSTADDMVIARQQEQRDDFIRRWCCGTMRRPP